jgi:FkbM family methyltransferase
MTKQLVQKVAARAGFLLEKRTVHTSSEHRRLALMRSLGIETVLDVGANAGQYGTALRKSGYRGRIVSFEPTPGAFARLEEVARTDALWDVRQLALSDDDGTTTMNVSASDPWSSLLDADPRADEIARIAPVAQVAVPMSRLDSLDGVVDERTWLKLDVQGFELHVLRGAKQALERISVVETEIMLEPFYAGQPTVREIVDVLDDHGFAFAAVDNGWVRESGRARWMDGVFVRQHRDAPTDAPVPARLSTS